MLTDTDIRTNLKEVVSYIKEKNPATKVYTFPIAITTTNTSNTEYSRPVFGDYDRINWLGFTCTTKKYWDRLLFPALMNYAKHWRVMLRHCYAKDNLLIPCFVSDGFRKDFRNVALDVVTMWFWRVPGKYHCEEYPQHPSGLLMDNGEVATCYTRVNGKWVRVRK